MEPTPEDLKAANELVGRDFEARALGTVTGRLSSYDIAKLITSARERGAQNERDALTVAARDVLAERRGHVEREGWTPEHDDEHDEGELSAAAAAYALSSASFLNPHSSGDHVGFPAPEFWPWEPSWWKPKDARSDLVRAGGLILAEIERIDRAKDGA